MERIRQLRRCHFLRCKVLMGAFLVVYALIVVSYLWIRVPGLSKAPRRRQQPQLEMRDDGQPLLDPNRTAYNRHPNTYSASNVDKTHCPAKKGRVDIMVVFTAESFGALYGVAQRTLQCYAKTANYRLHYIDLDNDPIVIKKCIHKEVVHFRRHCAVAAYLEGPLLKVTDWLLVLDADTGVVNPTKCIETFLDDRVNLIFYERIFNWEIACGNYIVRNTEWSRRFLFEFADMQYTQPKNWNGFDNGALQVYLGAERLYPKKLKILRRGHAWVRDTVMPDEDEWCEADFMIHAWKRNDIGDQDWNTPFTEVPGDHLSECVPKKLDWPWREQTHLSVDNMRTKIRAYEKFSQKVFPSVANSLPFIREMEIGECWPNCDDVS